MVVPRDAGCQPVEKIMLKTQDPEGVSHCKIGGPRQGPDWFMITLSVGFTHGYCWAAPPGLHSHIPRGSAISQLRCVLHAAFRGYRALP